MVTRGTPMVQNCARRDAPKEVADDADAVAAVRFGLTESSHARLNFDQKPYPDYTKCVCYRTINGLAIGSVIVFRCPSNCAPPSSTRNTTIPMAVCSGFGPATATTVATLCCAWTRADSYNWTCKATADARVRCTTAQIGRAHV